MAYSNPSAGLRREAGTTAATVANLTGTAGTADGAMADVGAAFSQGTLNDNFKELSVKVNAILTALRAAGIVT